MSTSQTTEASKNPKTARGQRTRNKLLEAAETAFGENGFHSTSIGDITRRASVALGTFYVYFDSKDEIFRALVMHLGHQVRAWVAEHSADAESRSDAEYKGLVAYIKFTRQHPNLYRIIEEAQFVAPDAYKAHYDRFAAGYGRALDEAEARGEIRGGDNEARAWGLIGLNVFLGLRFGVWNADKTPEEVADAAIGMISKGLQK